ncbi:MAG: DUF6079 family protein [Gallintestinimicrobium sp.]
MQNDAVNYRRVPYCQISRKLRGVEILSAAKLTKIEQDMANLKICYELTPTELKTTHICPHCHYNLDQVLNVAGQLDNLDVLGLMIW